MYSFKVFGVQRPPKRALGGPRGLPRGTQRAPKPNKKGIQKWTPKISIFGPILGQFWGPFWGQNWLQNGTKNGTTFGAILGAILGPDRAKKGPRKRAIKSSKDPKSCICKNLKNSSVFFRFLGSKGLSREP